MKPPGDANNALVAMQNNENNHGNDGPRGDSKERGHAENRVQRGSRVDLR